VTTVTSLASVVDEADANGVLRILLIGVRRVLRPYSLRVRPPLHRPRLALSTQALVALGVLLVLVLLASWGATAAVLHRDLESEYEQRALAIARSVAAEPGLAGRVASTRPDPDGPVERDAERVRRATGALYVVVTDDRGIRFSHPNRANIGKRVSTSPEAALSGAEVVTVERGTLGLSARGKVPLRDAAGRVVGEVSVGIDIAQLDAATHKVAVLLALVALAPLALGLVGAVLLARRLRRTTLGLEPEEMADLVREHAAVLGGVRDGVLAVDPGGRVTVSNAEAARLVGRPLPRGVVLADSGVGREVLALLEEEPAPNGALRLVSGRALIVTRVPVERGRRDLGTVLILRDRTDLDELARELEATRALTDALRAQAHEHSNRLHVLTGMVHHGDVEEVERYLSALNESHTWVTGVDDPYLAGLLAAKSAAATEAGVTLEVSDSSWVEGHLARPLDTVTVVANLLDNAVRAAADGARRPATVEVTLVGVGDDLVVHVADSGDGVSPEVRDRVFEHGFTTKPDRAGHGLGLALTRHTARSHGGDVRLVDPGGPEHGAVFEARLSGALVTRPAARPAGPGGRP
jgi:two-component system CitB family sensor kinase